MTIICQAKGLRRNLILLQHISISLHGYRECLNSACEIEILEGYIEGKSKAVNLISNDQQIVVPREQLVYSELFLNSHYPEVASISRCMSLIYHECP